MFVVKLITSIFQSFELHACGGNGAQGSSTYYIRQLGQQRRLNGRRAGGEDRFREGALTF